MNSWNDQWLLCKVAEWNRDRSANISGLFAHYSFIFLTEEFYHQGSTIWQVFSFLPLQIKITEFFKLFILVFFPHQMTFWIFFLADNVRLAFNKKIISQKEFEPAWNDNKSSFWFFTCNNLIQIYERRKSVLFCHVSHGKWHFNQILIFCPFLHSKKLLLTNALKQIIIYIIQFVKTNTWNTVASQGRNLKVKYAYLCLVIHILKKTQ